MILRKLPRIPSGIKSLILVSLGLIASQSYASDFRVGGGLGFGGAGAQKMTTLDGATKEVSRSESPGTISFFVDYLVSDQFTVGIDHSRGFRLGPASSGVSFTSFVWRWYFSGPVPSVAKPSSGATLLLKRITPFLGLAGGVAIADISRENDQVPEISGSGVFYGYRLGFDYPLSPGAGIRPEIVYSSSLSSSSLSSAALSLFSIQCGVYLFL